MKSGRDSYLQFFRYYHTLKDFKINQIISYLVFNYRRKYLTILNLKSISKIASSLKENFKFEDNEKLLIFDFFSKSIEVNVETINWNSNTLNLESEYHWLYYLNSFEWITNNKYKIDYLSFLVLDWISKNTDEHSFSWNPYVLSKRLISWIKWVNENKLSPEVSSIIKLSISMQLQRLFIDFEYHIPGNHLIENIRAFLDSCLFLIEAKQYFNDELESQLEQVLDEGLKQIEIQVLADGAHFERSPMLHCKVMKALKDIMQISSSLTKQKFLLPDLLEKAEKLSKVCSNKIINMTKWLEVMTMPDGEIAQFNDSNRCEGINNNFDNFENLFEPSGYFVKHNKNFSFIMSCDPVSPSFLTEHSHCDIFSYELAINGCRCIIDTGCSYYDNKTLRQMSRETESHNLPLVQGSEQSDIWGMNNIGKKAKILQRNYNKEESQIKVSIQDQYGQIIERKIEFSNNNIAFYDLLDKRRIQGCFISLIHLAPEITIEIIKEDNETNNIICTMPKDIKFSIITKANVRLDDYISFPEFGKSIGAKKIILSNKEAEELSYVIKW